MKRTARVVDAGSPLREKRRLGRPVKTEAKPLNRVREHRLARDLSLDALAELAGMTRSALSRIETGETVMNIDHMRRLAIALNIREDQLLASSARSAEVPVVGYVGAGSEVYPIDSDPEGLRQVDCPAHLDPATTVAVVVRGDSMYPVIDEGWLLFYSRKMQTVPGQVVGALCVVQVSDGRVLVKQIRRGPTKGHFNLISTNAPPIEDVKLDWAAKVRAILPPT